MLNRAIPFRSTQPSSLSFKSCRESSRSQREDTKHRLDYQLHNTQNDYRRHVRLQDIVNIIHAYINMIL